MLTFRSICRCSERSSNWAPRTFECYDPSRLAKFFKLVQSRVSPQKIEGSYYICCYHLFSVFFSTHALNPSFQQDSIINCFLKHSETTPGHLSSKVHGGAKASNMLHEFHPSKMQLGF